MDIRAAHVVGVLQDAPVTAAATGRPVESSQAAQKSSGNGDVSVAQLKEMIADMQSRLDSMNVGLRYEFYGKHDRNIAVQVTNKDTGEVIREIPPEEMQALQEKMGELVSMIFDKKA